MNRLTGTGKFKNYSINHDSVLHGEFEGNSENVGEVIESALFQNSAINSGFCSGDILFTNQSSNKKNLINYEPYPIVFSGSSVNKNTIWHAIFLDNSVNEGTIMGTVVFAASSVNKGTINIEATCKMLDSATNQGTIQGIASILEQSNVTNTGTINLSTNFTIPEGMFRYGSFRSYKKTAPFFPIKAERIGSFWYGYDLNGNASVANGVYHTGNPNGYSYFVNGTIKPFPSNFIKNGKYSNGLYENGILNTAYTSPSGIPEQAVDDFLFYIYTRLPYGVRKARGNYSIGVFENGNRINITSSNNSIPLQAKDNGKFYLYEAGWAVPAQGIYSIGCFISGKINSQINNKQPYRAKDNLLYYHFTNGWYPTLANGYYTTGIFVEGVKTSNTMVTPQTAKDYSIFSYVYENGIPYLASGPYAAGYFNYGQRLGGYTALTPQHPKDDLSIWKVYIDGFAHPPHGAYSIGYFISGEKTGTYPTPQKAIDNAGTLSSNKHYTYVDGNALVSQGNYSNGSFSQGFLNTAFNSQSRVQAIDNKLLYAYEFGLPIILNGKYWYPSVDEDWFNVNNWFVDINRTTIANALPLSSTEVILQGYKNVNIDLLDTRWVQPSSISSTSAGVVLINSKLKAVTCNIDTKLILRK